MNEMITHDEKERKLRCIRFFLHPLSEEDIRLVQNE